MRFRRRPDNPDRTKAMRHSSPLHVALTAAHRHRCGADDDPWWCGEHGDVRAAVGALERYGHLRGPQ